MSEEKIYQPGWEKAKEETAKKHRHHHHSSRSLQRDRGVAGALRMKDRQAYLGLMIVIGAVVLYAIYCLASMVLTELREMPKDDPATEMAVDELRIHKAEEQDAILLGDSLAQRYNVDSLKRQVQIETRPVYRPPRKENEWYITQREWKAIWKNYRIWKRMNEKEKQEKEQEKR